MRLDDQALLPHRHRQLQPEDRAVVRGRGPADGRPDIGADLTDLFNTLTGYSRKKEYRNIPAAPQGIRAGIIERIHREIELFRAGDDRARVQLKANALVDEQVIDALYRASQNGVPVDVVVRGISALRPGMEGVSDNINVRSILGQFLEHSRILHFGAQNEY